MARAGIIEVALPEGIHVSPLDVEVLKATFQALAALRTEAGGEWAKVLGELERDGWAVQWGLCWHAEAKRAGDFEHAHGKTLDETFSELSQLARLDAVGHCP
jgi:hypothetical protein